jgi:hypothetical protein
MTSKWLLTAGSLVALGLSGVPAANAECDIYAVQLHGDVSNSFGTQEFTVTEAGILLQPGHRGNQVDFALLTQGGLNGAAPPIGAIELMTNSLFARNPGMAAAGLDLAQVTVSNGAQFQLNSGMSYQMPQPNVFIGSGPAASTGGLGGLCYLNVPGLCDIGKASTLQAAYMIPHTGSGTLTGSAQTIAGTISLIGSSLDNASFQAKYQAEFEGHLVGNCE